MNCLGCHPTNRLRLTPRNEGAIKSYESCRDLRAWSHDNCRKDAYLKEWIKNDMSVSVVPASTLISIVKKMTYGSLGKTIPRCHPQCKSRVVLESICSSCHVMKECLRKEKGFDKFFEDEEFETSHWPCEKCLEALKTLKMFWKVIVDKLFHIKLAKTGPFEGTGHDRSDCVRSVARVWENDLTRQALFVKGVGQALDRDIISWMTTTEKYDNVDSLKTKREASIESKDEAVKTKEDKITDTQDLHSISKVKTNDFVCQCTSINDEINAFKANMNILQAKTRIQDTELQRLTKENDSLKTKLHSLYKNMWGNSVSTHLTTPVIPNSRTSRCCDEALPKPFENCEDNVLIDTIKPVESEVIITIKNCKDETYKYISLLQVLHKSNEPVLTDYKMDESKSKKQDPSALLTKVQSTFGEMVNREIKLAKKKSSGCSKSCDIDIECHKIGATRSEPSFTTITTTTTESGFNLSPGLETYSLSTGEK